MRKIILSVIALASAGVLTAQSVDWPEIKTEAKPGTRWWWLGSAVDKDNLTWSLEEYARAGIGAVEITPIYGVVGNEKNDINYLSDQWMEMLRHTEAEGKRLGIEIDMNNGTGWPFGGPEVPLEEAASMAVFSEWEIPAQDLTKAEKRQLKRGRTVTTDYACSLLPKDKKKLQQIQYATFAGAWLYDDEGNVTDISASVNSNTLSCKVDKTKHYRGVALWNGHTRQEVKRAAPGGEGYVMDHLNPKAVRNYFSKFTEAFKRTGTAVPHTFFNDSYEVYQADWTPAMLTEFEARRGYRLQDHFPEFLDENAPNHKRIVSDYRETMSDLLLEVFTHYWADWAHQNGAIVRNQAHGSPANLLDVYAAVDIPEIEGFGLSDFKIKGLRTDSLWKKNDSDLSMLKYAGSAAHVTGKPYTSSETFTWLTEHFRTSLSQCKPDMDLMLVSGVNHVFFHGTTYSPREVAWPGWLFYASMEMSPFNTLWEAAPAFFDYIARAQSFMQWGQPDNDFLVYLPFYDMLNDLDGRYVMFAIHGMEKKAPKFVKAVNTIYEAGYDMDYISDRMIADTRVEDGKIVTSGGTAYKALILPQVKFMQPETLEHLVSLAQEGATIIFVAGYPESVPGLGNEAERRYKLADAVAKLPTSQFTVDGVADPMGKGRIITAGNYKAVLNLAADIKPETMKSDFGLKSIRRRNDTGYHYFISSLQKNDVDAWVTLAVDAADAMIFDPMSGRKGKAMIRKNQVGATEVKLQLRSGESCILQTYNQALTGDVQPWTYLTDAAETVAFNAPWSLSFPKSEPQVSETFRLETLKPWTALGNETLNTLRGTGRYTTTVNIPAKMMKAGYADWVLDLGDVRESAHVKVNGQDAGTVFAVPYRLSVGQYLKKGKNVIEIEVTGLAANRIAQMDRNGEPWRKFKNANIAPLPGTDKVSDFKTWGTIPCGLNSEVKLIPQNAVTE